MTTVTGGDENKTDTGIKPNIAALLCYVLGFVSGLVFLLIEKNKFVKFHALQSIATFLGLFIVRLGLLVIPVLGLLLSGLVALAAVILWVVLMVKAYQGEKFKLPYVGDWVEKYV
ncbi:MAG: hypothetical protein A3G33_01625 [Omnitrophica bacterium RIFCSPLOWO2_12_FULL_44_17]|uniref:DUF4870 domain-containing protein n=1 Tax=Candidatus Danuiimicrobium aquiferis TaxID=1801832 RepID=A0A1G1KV18_9BACT|nr:MAG: hypothetical protein A3B72_00860 [Omnitrophica bacterium RIFCSPHIGHO2_02_FULL_45_28]OGW92509.1 MAG: hypothetical protein A3E74_09320 [Omnitrophica bacterium RIFCSPHIGHO2_12_FULL_44_12]OGW96814.1 MAG: hypothetical protein A3G33_01625 [Omnitrophica bacterium RIFCSPLOWO2_12_FULL_44_17]OGX03816.1 MAG: hypothetical protein A3J12_09515 [Omnitrophica bacterium RIFCSPLOWO2_02_FULL_44_11]